MNTTTITQQLETVKHIDLNMFYSVTLTDFSVRLQGTLTSEKKQYCESLGFQFEITPNDWIKAEKENIIVILTF